MDIEDVDLAHSIRFSVKSDLVQGLFNAKIGPYLWPRVHVPLLYLRTLQLGNIRPYAASHDKCA